jgi:hypothetical protein
MNNIDRVPLTLTVRMTAKVTTKEFNFGKRISERRMPFYFSCLKEMKILLEKEITKKENDSIEGGRDRNVIDHY